MSYKNFLSQEECKAIFDRVVALGAGGGETTVSIVSKYTGSATWARNRVHVSQAIQGLYVTIFRSIRGANSGVSTTRIDEAGLREAVKIAESSLSWKMESPEQMTMPKLDESILKPTLWSDSTYAFDGARRGELAQQMIAPAEEAGLLSAGELLISGEGHAVLNTEGVSRYYPVTDVECSMSVRNPKGTASGWAGKTHYTLDQIDARAIAATALDKCIRSADPSALEPGRYVTIMEPQAVADLFAPIMHPNSGNIERTAAEGMRGPFAFQPGRSKIGQRVLDPRLTVRSDPMEPDGGFVPFHQYEGVPYQPVSWMDQGYLRELSYFRDYALGVLNKPQPLMLQGSYHMSSNAPSVSIDEMIRTTQRGLLVTRFNNVQVVHRDSMLCTGFTRDGLWLIEKGKITRPVKNFRFTESPLFVLNSLEATGDPVRIFDREFARIVPAIKVRDFSFTSSADAV